MVGPLLPNNKSLIFDPASLRPEASLNRSVIPDLPFLPRDVIGSSGYELLSAEALNRQILSSIDVLRIDPAGDLPRQLGGMVEDPDHPGHRESRRIVAAYARNLGLFIAAIANRSGSDQDTALTWGDLLVKHWRKIKKVVLGGGLVSGRTGPLVVLSARKTVDEVSPRKIAVELADHPRFLPLVGAARCVSKGAHNSLVFDFGHSSLKRGLASYANGALAALRVLPTISTGEVTQSDRHRLASFMVDTIVQTARETGDSFSGQFAISLASYIDSGQPYQYQGGLYAELRDRPKPLQDWLQEKTSKALGMDTAVKLLHDGTAAAMCYSEEPNAAVIMLGTALGVGFASQNKDLRIVSEQFELLTSN